MKTIEEHYIGKVGQMWICNVYQSIPKVHLTAVKEEACSLTYDQGQWVKQIIAAELTRVTVTVEEEECVKPLGGKENEQ